MYLRKVLKVVLLVKVNGLKHPLKILIIIDIFLNINLPILLSLYLLTVLIIIAPLILISYKNEISLLCITIIDSCVSAGKNCIPVTGHNPKKKSVPGWLEQVAP